MLRTSTSARLSLDCRRAVPGGCSLLDILITSETTKFFTPSERQRHSATAGTARHGAVRLDHQYRRTHAHGGHEHRLKRTFALVARDDLPAGLDHLDENVHAKALARAHAGHSAHPYWYAAASGAPLAGRAHT